MCELCKKAGLAVAEHRYAASALVQSYATMSSGNDRISQVLSRGSTRAVDDLDQDLSIFMVHKTNIICVGSIMLQICLKQYNHKRIYAYIHTYIYRFIHTYIHTYIQVYADTMRIEDAAEQMRLKIRDDRGMYAYVSSIYHVCVHIIYIYIYMTKL